jgi:hypothetical protein
MRPGDPARRVPDKLNMPKLIDTAYFAMTPASWDEAKEIGKRLQLFAFRGQSNNQWPLATTLERATKHLSVAPDQLWMLEQDILRSFKARAHHFLQSPPSDADLIEWLSIMQGYGAPTRLLDFTESFYLAAFFAMHAATDDACIWAVNNVPLFINARFTEEIGFEDGKRYLPVTEPVLRFAQSFISDPAKRQALVLRVEPPRLNERAAIQRGLFLFPCDLTRSFEANLCSSFGFPFETLDPSNATPKRIQDLGEPIDNIDPTLAVGKINLPKTFHPEALSDLYSMNIHAASLFPGLEGFARSLGAFHRNAIHSIAITTMKD